MLNHLGIIRHDPDIFLLFHADDQLKILDIWWFGMWANEPNTNLKITET